jgi:hypothetical protein
MRRARTSSRDAFRGSRTASPSCGVASRAARSISIRCSSTSAAARRGFPPAVAHELGALRAYYAELHPSKQSTWDMVEREQISAAHAHFRFVH